MCPVVMCSRCQFSESCNGSVCCLVSVSYITDDVDVITLLTANYHCLVVSVVARSPRCVSTPTKSLRSVRTPLLLNYRAMSLIMSKHGHSFVTSHAPVCSLISLHSFYLLKL